MGHDVMARHRAAEQSGHLLVLEKQPPLEKRTLAAECQRHALVAMAQQHLPSRPRLTKANFDHQLLARHGNRESLVEFWQNSDRVAAGLMSHHSERYCSTAERLLHRTHLGWAHGAAFENNLHSQIET